MDRIEAIQKYVDSIISEMKSENDRKSARIHTYGVAQCCSLLAKRRKLNSELAYISGLLHDVYAYKTGSYMYHAQSGADMVRVAVRNMSFSDDERMIILSAIYHHANKDLIHDAYDEVLKDADILQPFLNAGDIKIFYPARQRLEKILESLNITFSHIMENHGATSVKKAGSFQRDLLADVAQELAAMKIWGEKSDKNFMQIIRYYPELTAFDELKYAWCAAFIYHCIVEAGLELPIRYKPKSNTRFACVEAWLKWGEINGFCFFETDKFLPARGDIIIYNNIISPGNKPVNTPWYDHIGIVLSVDCENLTVAEGNVDNKNVSGIIERRRYENIGCYLRIPDGYEYDGWKYDYKTDQPRTEKMNIIFSS